MTKIHNSPEMVAEVIELVSNRVLGLTNEFQSVKEFDGVMNMIISELANDINAFPFAYNIIAHVAVKQHAQIIAEENLLEKQFQQGVIQYWENKFTEIKK